MVKKKRLRTSSDDQTFQKVSDSSHGIDYSSFGTGGRNERSKRRPFTPIKIDNEYLAQSDSSNSFINSIESEIEALRAQRTSQCTLLDSSDSSDDGAVKKDLQQLNSQLETKEEPKAEPIVTVEADGEENERNDLSSSDE
jgi:hypothetical protein